MINIKKTIGILLLGLITQFAFAGGGGSIKGNLIDETGQPIMYANIFFYEGSTIRGDQSDENGKFNIKAITPGNYDIFITALGFDTIKLKGVRVISDRITMLRNNTMKLKSLIAADVIEYIWEIPLIDIDEPGAIIFGAKEIEMLAGKNNLNSMIASITPGVYQKEPGDPLQLRGSRSGATTYFVDGVKLEGISNTFPSASVGTIRVFTGGVPAMYGDIVGGVIIIETKSFLSWYND